ncbi:hypothetical protein [Streptomyces sp. NPDC047981]|uniref:hypothetical protein n=1 Tax=Streptomyces sp. NPDC047981 TaxID=3154610 RepID=UPI00344153FC
MWIPDNAGAEACFAYGVPVHTFGRLYGIMRPCPEVLLLSPQLVYQRVFVRNAREAQALEDGGLRSNLITRFDLTDDEQMTLC